MKKQKHLNKKSFLKGLTPEQTDAVRHKDGPALVVSGPGSGKTRVITHRIAYLLARGVDPAEIVAVTFTNKAAREMKERVKDLVGRTRSKHVTCSTFHSYCFTLLKRHGALDVFPYNYSKWSICDQDQGDALVVLALLKVLGLESEKDLKEYAARSNLVYPQYLEKGFLKSQISKIKQQLLTPEKYLSSLRDSDLKRPKTARSTKHLAEVYKQYQTLLEQALLLDFDDLLSIIARALRDSVAFRKHVSSGIRYLLVDEYQDTNMAQFEICRHLAYKRRNIFAVGDADQAIYKFRGADHTNVDRYKEVYGPHGLRTYLLEKNFRSTRAIANVANASIRYNLSRVDKTIDPVKEAGVTPTHYIFVDQSQEAAVFTSIIKADLMRDRLAPGDITILYRTKVQSRRFEENLIRHNIPYRVVGSLGFYDRKIIKDALAYAKLSFNKKDDTSFMRVCNYPPRGLGKAALATIMALASKYECSFAEVVLKQKFRKSKLVKPALKEKLERFRKVLKRIRRTRKLYKKENAGFHIAEIISLTGLERYLKDPRETSAKTLADNQRRLDHLDELITSATEFGSSISGEQKGGALRDYLDWISLVQQQDSNDEDTNRVTLMTCHAAKGLEFKKVFIIGCNNWLMPHYRCGINSEDHGSEHRYVPEDKLVASLEEERRLFYVAVTRAEDELVLGCPLTVTHGSDDKKWAGLSLFALEAWHTLDQKSFVEDFTIPSQEEIFNLRDRAVTSHMGLDVGEKLSEQYRKLDPKPSMVDSNDQKKHQATTYSKRKDRGSETSDGRRRNISLFSR